MSRDTLTVGLQALDIMEALQIKLYNAILASLNSLGLDGDPFIEHLHEEILSLIEKNRSEIRLGNRNLLLFYAKKLDTKLGIFSGLTGLLCEEIDTTISQMEQEETAKYLH